VEIVSLGSKSEHGGLGLMFAFVVFDAIICHDLLLKMLHRTRPYEIEKGASEAVFESYIGKLIDLVPEHKRKVESHKLAAMLNTKHLGELEELLRRAQARNRSRG